MAAPARFSAAPLPAWMVQNGSWDDGNSHAVGPRAQGRRRPRFGIPVLPFASLSATGSGGPQLSNKEAAAAADGTPPATAEDYPSTIRGTAPDTFKKGDALAAGRYTLEQKIADGRFTSIWLGTDARSGAGGSKVVLKLMEAGDAPSYAAGAREAQAHAAAGRHPNVVTLLGTFEHRSPAGRHACMVLEPLGSSLDEVMDKAAGGLGLGLPLDVVKSVARQSLQALDHLHRDKQLVHMAVTPENLLLDRPFKSLIPPPPSNPLEALGRWVAEGWEAITGGGGGGNARQREEGSGNQPSGNALEQQQQQQQSPGSGSSGGPAAVNGQDHGQDHYTEADLARAAVKICDFGRALPLDDLDGPRGREPYVIFANPGFRPPEEILGLEYRTPSYDMWGLGCTLYALATGSQLFTPPEDATAWAAAFAAAAGGASDAKSGNGGKGGTDPLGGEQYGRDDAHLAQMLGLLGRMPREMVKASPLRTLLFLPSGRIRLEAQFTVEQEPLKQVLMGGYGMDDEEAAGFAGFLRPLLELSPDRRPSAAKMLRHPWLKEEEEAAPAAAATADGGSSGKGRKK